MACQIEKKHLSLITVKQNRWPWTFSDFLVFSERIIHFSKKILDIKFYQKLNWATYLNMTSIPLAKRIFALKNGLKLKIYLSFCRCRREVQTTSDVCSSNTGNRRGTWTEFFYIRLSRHWAKSPFASLNDVISMAGGCSLFILSEFLKS